MAFIPANKQPKVGDTVTLTLKEMIQKNLKVEKMLAFRLRNAVRHLQRRLS